MGLFNNKKNEKLLNLQKIVLENSPDRLIMTERQLIASAESMAQRDLEIIQDCIRLIGDTKNPDTFFSRFDLLVEKADHLRLFEDYISFTASPSLAFGEVWADQQEAIKRFLIRYFCDVFDKAEAAKTDKGKLSKYQKFYDSLQPYYHKMNADNIDYIETKYRAYTKAVTAPKKENDSSVVLTEEELKKKRQEQQYIETVLLPWLRTQVEDVVSKNPGILQTDVYKLYHENMKPHVQTVLYYMDRDGIIERTKQGRTYSLKMNG